MQMLYKTPSPNGVHMSTLVIRSSQKTFTEEEVSGLTGICQEHLRNLARSRHLGVLARAAEAAAEAAGAAGQHAERLLFSNSDLMVLAMLHTRCEH
jgi:hypothetical protein